MRYDPCCTASTGGYVSLTTRADTSPISPGLCKKYEPHRALSISNQPHVLFLSKRHVSFLSSSLAAAAETSATRWTGWSCRGRDYEVYVTSWRSSEFLLNLRDAENK